MKVLCIGRARRSLIPRWLADIDSQPNMGLKRPISHFSVFWLAALVESALMRYFWRIEFRPNELASPRYMRRTDDLLPNLD